MRSAHLWSAFSLFVAASSLAVAGCDLFARYSACALDPDCIRASSGGSSSSGNDGGPPPECIPSLSSTPVDDTCGVFVSSSLGDDANAGNTKSSPVKTLKQALLLGAQQNLPVYACAEVFANADAETLSVSAGSILFGGLDCAGDWNHTAAAKSTVQGAPDAIATVLRTGSGTTHIEDFVFRAPDATLDGGSSIAVLSEPLSVELVRCELIAGNGKDGAKGVTPTDNIGPSDPNDAAIKGSNGAKASADMGMPNAGGAGAVNALCSSAVGGKGGDGFVDHGGDGGDGLPMGVLGTHGTGEPVMGSWNCAVGAGFGGAQIGDNGAAGTEGASATDSDLGSLDLNGFVAAAGKPGTEGAPGQGGGGAGAAKGKTGFNGASGGGGGAGGCGGKGGGGGQGGGAGIALASLGATFVFNSVSLSAGNGGSGGDGSDGQVGAVGGAGGAGGLGDSMGMPTLAACDGGKGGSGGLGGKGGAGRGGHSLGIAHTGPAPSLEGLTFSLGTPGPGGSAFMSNGAAGIQANTLEFP